MFIKGHARPTLYKNTSLNVTGSGGASLGVFNVGHYSRIAGFISNISSVTLRYQFGVDSSAFQISSSTTINSGGGIIDAVNYGHHVSLSLSQAASQSGIAILLYGESIR